MKKLYAVLAVMLATVALVATSPASARTAHPVSGCFITGVVVENATINGHLYVRLRAPSNCGFGVSRFSQKWKIVIRDANGFRTIHRSGGSATGNIRVAGSVATVWAQFTARHGSSSATKGGHRTVYLYQG